MTSEYICNTKPLSNSIYTFTVSTPFYGFNYLTIINFYIFLKIFEDILLYKLTQTSSL